MIAAVAPAVPRGAVVPITVEAASGAATSNAKFAFLGCHVPRLKDDRVRRARKTLVASGCKAGQVRRAHGADKPLRVIAESPRPGAWLAPGSPVRLRVR